jgi:predicted CXXCH cytochrome family protein
MSQKFLHRKDISDRHLLYAIPVVLLLIYLSGCSTTNNYKTLSFFFDGVPDPKKKVLIKSDSLTISDSAALAQNTIGKVNQMVIHPPYQDRQCSSCHDQSTMGKLIKSPPDLCYQCHENFNDKYNVVHGPVEGGYCTQCHNPHISANKDLLLRNSQSLCLYCHDSKQVMETEAHLAINDADCTGCHNPHGGEDRNLLR